MAEQLVEDPVARTRYAFRRFADDDGTEVLRVELWVDPGGEAPPHHHPRHEERFEVLEGEMTFTLGRSEQMVGPGESVIAPAGVRHAFRNSGEATVHMRADCRPPMQMEALLSDFAAAGRAGYLGRLGSLRFPKGLGGLLQVALLTRHYRQNETMVALVPPPLVQRLLLDPFARLAKRRGYSVGASASRSPA
jgi:quercetin dioxygenase-like cupin family protein